MYALRRYSRQTDRCNSPPRPRRPGAPRAAAGPSPVPPQRDVRLAGPRPPRRRPRGPRAVLVRVRLRLEGRGHSLARLPALRHPAGLVAGRPPRGGRAGEGNRTPICGLGSHRLSHWTTPAGQAIVTGRLRWTVRLALPVLLVLRSGARALAAEPRTTLPDVEDEVMCVECGTALNVSTSPVADREREFIRRRIAEGKSKAEIKAALVAEYGPRVLAMPEGGGFDVAAWLVPGAAVRCWRCSPCGVAALRWRGRPAEDAEPGRARSRPRRRARASTPTWRRSTGERRRRHDGAGRVRGRLRVVHLPVRAAARARLPVGRLGRRRWTRSSDGDRRAGACCCRRSSSASPSPSCSWCSG